MLLVLVGVELPLCDCHFILECCVMFSGVKLSIRSFNLFIYVGVMRYFNSTSLVFKTLKPELMKVSFVT